MLKLLRTRITFCAIPSLMALCILPIAVDAQQPAKAKAPAIPAGVNAQERATLMLCQSALSDGKFDLVTTRLTSLLPANVVPVYVDWTPVAPASRAAAKRSGAAAIQAWNAALAGSVRFQLVEREEAADLRILFDRDVAHVLNGQATLSGCDLRLDPAVAAGSAKRRTAEARIALSMPYTESPHTPASLTHLFGQALGLYLGLAPSTNAADLMGPDTYTPTVAQTASRQDIARFKELQEARLALAGLAKRHVAAYLPKAVLALDKEEIDAGEVQRGDKAHFVFTLHNTGDAPLEVDAHPTCGCTVANFDKVIAPGGSGKVEADINTASFRGKITKHIDLTTNDVQQPKRGLNLTATVQSAITILPSEVLMAALKDTEPTVKELEIRTSGKEPVEVTGASCTVPYASAQLDSMPAPATGGRAYKLTVTIKPEAPVGRSAFLVSVHSSSAREPNTNITTICDKGIIAMPPSLYMGSITPSTALPLTTMFTLSRAEGTFHIRKVTSDDPGLQVKEESIQEGRQYRVTVTYKGGWAAGSARHSITVETDDPHQSHLRIPVMGNVAGSASR
jgi:hypothetical protein